MKKDEVTHYRQLIAFIAPDGVVFDWEKTDKLNPTTAYAWQKTFYDAVVAHPDKTLLELGFAQSPKLMTPSVAFVAQVAEAFTQALARVSELETLRGTAEVVLTDEVVQQLLAQAPFMLGLEALTADWIGAIVGQLNRAFAGEIANYQGSVAAYFSDKKGLLHPMGRVFFHLVENKEDEAPFAFLATYTEVADNGTRKHMPLKNALLAYQNDQEALLSLLSTVNQAQKLSSFVNQLVRSGEIFHPLKFTADEAFIFLQEVPLYESCGIICRVPNWWKHKSAGVKVSISVGEQTPSRVGFDALVDFRVAITVGDDELSVAELQAIAEEAQGLRLIKGKWVAVDQRKLQEALAVYEQIKETLNGGEVTISEAMRMQLSGLAALGIADDQGETEVTQGQWLKLWLDKLSHPAQLPEVDLGDDFQAQLRGYQAEGVRWLAGMHSMGFGACLADDMGLGKTVQVLALLNSLRATGAVKTLLVVPASLIANWVDEIHKFAPQLRYQVLHPSVKKGAVSADTLDLSQCDLVITTYGMVARYGWLAEISWDLLIIDEAQAIKNAGTKQTKSVKNLSAQSRIALTGTPIENRLGDLWSLFDFLNKGLLGNTTEFGRLSKGLKERPEGYGRLKKAISPFMLRRLKTDKTIINDLPDKIEMKTYATLTKKQKVLYQQVVQELTALLQGSEGIGRQGLVLASLVKFKQICNHPDQYLGQDVYLESESGKFARLREICEEIAQKRERVLVFTQFRQMVEPLANFLSQVFDHPGLTLDGGTATAKRQKIVEQFQGEAYVPFLVLSIKAGGVGLNLTAANHVIHFDRWWNPAVENQATDRAFRIGQQKNVIVHKFVVAGTIEEKIDLMIEDKIKLSDEVMPDLGENAITQLDDQALLELIRLGEG